MSIQMRIPLDALTDPAVSKALSDLVLALGGKPPVRPSKAAVSAVRATKAPATRKGRRKKKAEPKTWEEFETTLSDKTRKFLALVVDRKKLSLAEALETLGLPGGKSLGGLTGALARKAKNRGFELPYEQKKDRKGVRMWVAKTAASSKEASKGPTRRVFRRKARDKAAPQPA